MSHSDTNSITVYDSLGPAYSQAFAVFLAHTDQKTNANAWLESQVSGLARRGVFIDAGAGTGKLTQWLQPHFQQTIAIEPNASLREELQTTCAGAQVVATPIVEAQPNALADFVLCSHVFYYIDRHHWGANLQALTRWLATGGVLAIALQNPDTDCMRMLRHFTGEAFDLASLGNTYRDAAAERFEVRVETVEAHVQTDSAQAAYTIAEFMLNLLPLAMPPRRTELQQYVDTHFRRHEGYRFSCHQDFLRVQRVV